MACTLTERWPWTKPGMRRHPEAHKSRSCKCRLLVDTALQQSCLHGLHNLRSVSVAAVPLEVDSDPLITEVLWNQGYHELHARLCDAHYNGSQLWEESPHDFSIRSANRSKHLAFWWPLKLPQGPVRKAEVAAATTALMSSPPATWRSAVIVEPSVGLQTAKDIWARE